MFSQVSPQEIVVHVQSASWGPALVVATVVGASTLLLAFNQQRLFITQMMLSRIDRFFDSDFYRDRRRVAAQSWLDAHPSGDGEVTVDTDAEVESGAAGAVMNGLEELAILRDRRFMSFRVIRDSMGWWIAIYWTAYQPTLQEIRNESGDQKAWIGTQNMAKKLQRKGFAPSDTQIRSLLTDDAGTLSANAP